ncbi:MAG: GntR family transcriptional regulator [Bacteroidaceae bacterium]|nr:GntR family transcriptional regulator [Bacteroidaceae bacterium]
MKFKETKSIYQQIADRLCDEILQGSYHEEERIPSVREYAATVEVNANTVVRSYDQLQGQEIIYNKRGIGYFVAVGAVERIKQLRRTTFLSDELPEFFGSLTTLDISIEEIEKLYKEWREREALV